MTLNDEKSEQKPTGKIAVIYRAGEGDPVSTVWRGRTFIKDKPVEFDLENEAEAGIVEAARGNPSFDVDGENKAEKRDEIVVAKRREEAEVELTKLEEEGAAIEQRHTTEVNEMEARHAHEREDFLNRNEQRSIELRRVIRGSDGSDDLHPLDEPHDDPNNPGIPKEPYPAPISEPVQPVVPAVQGNQVG